MMTRKIAILSWALLVGAIGLSCNEGVVGFNAESGSTISLSDCPSVQTNTTALVLITATVTGASAGTSGPLSGIQIQFICTLCNIFDKADGEEMIILDPARLKAVSNPYIVKTGSRGTYQVVVETTAPANLGLTSYNATLGADIGVGSAIATCPVAALQ